MAPTTVTALLLLVGFVLPGFVTLVINERTHAVPTSMTAFERLLRSLYYSVLVYALLAPVGWLAGADREDIERFVTEEQNLGELAGVGALVLFVVPTIISTASRLWEIWPARDWLLQRLRISPTHRTQTAWDHFYSQRQPALVRLTLDDGRVVGGYYGEDSLAAYGEQAGDLYLQQRWVLDDDKWFVEPAPGTLGLWVAADEIVSFELYAPPAASAGEADT